MTVLLVAAALAAGAALTVVVQALARRWRRTPAPPPPPPFDGTLRCATPGCHVPLGRTSYRRTVAFCSECRPSPPVTVPER